LKEAVMRLILGVLVISLMSLRSPAAISHATRDSAFDCPKVAQIDVTQLTSLDFKNCDLTGWVLDFADGSQMAVPERGLVLTKHDLLDESATAIQKAYAEISVYHSKSGGVAVAIADDVFLATDSESLAELESYFRKDFDSWSIEETDISNGATQALLSAKCTATSAYSLNSRWYYKEYAYRLNSSGNPGSGWSTRIVTAADNLDMGRSNECGNLSNGLKTTYLGTTTNSVNVTPTGCTANGDGQNTIGFGDLSGPDMGRMCGWNTILGNKKEADIKFDTSGRSWWLNASTTGCPGGKYDLQGAATHEFGHAAGLNHVSSSTQVMYTTLYTCEFKFRDLGRGDQNGLRAQYGSS
jgi:hypothetical protein